MVNDVLQRMNTSFQKFLSVGTPKRLTMMTSPRIILAMKNLIPSERNGGIVSRPSFTAAHDEPQRRQMTRNPE
jgi:hypothetical protein